MRKTSTTLLLLRHGQSEWNAAGRWQGAADSPLTHLGRTQARETGSLLRSLGIDFSALWSSDLQRAAETALLIGTELGLGGQKVDARLRESEAGEWQGLTQSEIEAQWPGYLAAHRRPPSFEEFESVAERALSALRGIANDANGTDRVPLVVTHSGVIRTVIRILKESDSRVPNLGGTWLTIDSSVRPVGPVDISGITLGVRFDPAGIQPSGTESPDEDPGDRTD